MAYISRLKVSHKYLDQLNKDSRVVQDMVSPVIERSALFNLTDSQSRMDLAIATTRIALEELSEYGRNKSLLSRLQS